MKWVFALCAFLIVSCTDSGNGKASVQSNSTPNTLGTSSDSQLYTGEQTHAVSKNESKSLIEQDSITVLVLPTSDGYNFATYNYDFVPLLEKELNKEKGIHVLPFPFKTLMNTGYLGVYDKKYCGKIIEKIDVDYIVMSQFTGTSPFTYNSEKVKWGYEIKILNTRTMNQKISIGKSNLKDYNDIEKDITNNIIRLIQDIRNLK